MATLFSISLDFTTLTTSRGNFPTLVPLENGSDVTGGVFNARHTAKFQDVDRSASWCIGAIDPVEDWQLSMDAVRESIGSHNEPGKFNDR